jgi:L-fuculose-phosphate aldolase
MSTSASADRDAGARRLVSEACRVLAAMGHSDLIWGHASVRDPETGGAWIKQSGWGLDETDPSRVHLVGRDGQILVGDGRRHLEYPIHTEIYAARPDVGGVVHTHGRYSLALAASGAEISPVSHEGCLFVAPALPRFTATADLIHDQRLGADLATTLGDARAVFLVNHGTVCVGRTVREAAVTAVLLERACQQQLLTAGYGGARYWSDDDEARTKRERIFNDGQLADVWNYLVRSLGPDVSPEEPA